MTSVIPVLLYHSVNDEPADEAWGAVSRAEFSAHVEAISVSGRAALNVTELADALRGERAIPERPVAITFDDGFDDTYDAVETLARHGLTATVYVTTGEVGARNRLSPALIADLAGHSAVELGSHAVRHRPLDELDDRELDAEVRLSRAQLEDLIGASVHSFAYPHGAHDRRVRSAVVAAGYRSAAAVKNAVSHPRDDPFAIARWTVKGGTSAARLARVLEGDQVPRAWARERMRTRAYRSVRRGRRRLKHAIGVRC